VVLSTLALTQAACWQNHTLGGFLRQAAGAASPSIWRDTPPGLVMQRRQTRSKGKMRFGFAYLLLLTQAQALSTNKHFTTWLSPL
jgi:hypothetical protein